MDSRLAASGYSVKPGYRHREKPEFSADLPTAQNGITYQPDVYRFAGFLAKQFGCETVIALGCGSGEELSKLAAEFRLVGVDCGENTRHFQQLHSQASCLEHDFATQVLHIEDRDLVRRSIVVCTDVIERLPDPSPLLASIRDFLRDAPVALLTTPERDLVRGLNHMGPPDNPHHVRERSLPEFASLLRGAGLDLEFVGLTCSNHDDWSKRTTLAILRQAGTQDWVSAPPQFRVLAVMCAYNEEDIIESTLQHLTSQGIEVHLVDNWCTDGTVERARAFLGHGLTAITKFPAAGPSATYDWHALLTHVEEISFNSKADWIIHHDADEIRESPWPRVQLRDAIYRVDREGFNAIDHTCLVFHPTSGGFEDPAVISSYKYFEFGQRPGHFLQRKAWKRQNVRVRLADSGGHTVEFYGCRTYPYKFLLRHYPIRSQEHGISKILHDRQLRWNQFERQSKVWHIQYDHVDNNHNFLRDPTSLREFKPDSFCTEYLVERLSGIGAERH